MSRHPKPESDPVPAADADGGSDSASGAAPAPSPDTAAPDVSAARRQVMADVRTLLRSGEVLQEAIRSDRDVLLAGLDLLASDLPIAEVLRVTDAGARRQQLSARLQEFEACRHQLRLSIAAAATEEDMSVTDIGRALEVSRQLAGRYLKEAGERACPPSAGGAGAAAPTAATGPAGR